jgi:triosephosphate isomerase
MRKKIAAANWKMNLTIQQGTELVNAFVKENLQLASHQQVLLAVPFPYLTQVAKQLEGTKGFALAAQNCHHLKSGAYTGEVAASMLQSVGINYCVLGHSERREYNAETNAMLTEKVLRCFENGITPVFCCGEPLPIREAGQQNEFVAKQLEESLFGFSADDFKKIIIAYEPIWAIGTGKTASTEQAQEIHAYIRSVIAAKYGTDLANEISILYGGSVKASNAQELFASPDVDGGLVGGASLQAEEFTAIIKALPC